MLVYYDDVAPSFLDATRALDSAKRYREATEEMARSDPRNTSALRSRAIATYSVAFYLSHSDPNAAVVLARDALRMFDDMIAAGNTDYLTVSRRVRALRRLGQAELKAGRVKEAMVTIRAALDSERKIAAQNKIGPDEEMIMVHLLTLDSRVNELSGNSGGAEPQLLEAKQRALRMAQNGLLTNVVSLANAEQALGEFYARARRTEEARASYQRLSEIWQRFPENNDYLEMQRAASKRLLASVQ
jgi:tetratricopeptide (TPR) repeat protein